MKKLLLYILILSLFDTSYGGSVVWGYDADNNTGGFGMFLPESFTEMVSISIKMIVSDENQVILKNNGLDEYIAAWGMMALQTIYNTPIDRNLFWDPSAKFFQGYNSAGAPTSDVNLIIPKTEEDLSNTVLLAFVVGYFGGSHGYDDWWYGWIEFGYRDATGYGDMEVYIVDSALSETIKQGIYAGRHAVIPEPSTALLALSGIALLLRRYRTSQEETS